MKALKPLKPFLYGMFVIASQSLVAHANRPFDLSRYKEAVEANDSTLVNGPKIDREAGKKILTSLATQSSSCAGDVACLQKSRSDLAEVIMRFSEDEQYKIGVALRGDLDAAIKEATYRALENADRAADAQLKKILGDKGNPGDRNGQGVEK